MPEEIVEEVEELDVDAAEVAASEEVNAAAGAEAPVSSVPLPVSKVNRMAKALSSAFDAITDGELPLVVGEIGEDTEDLPPDIYGPLTVMAEGMDFAVESGVVDAEKYTFDPVAIASSPAGLDEGYGTFFEMAKDRALIDALTEPPPVEVEEEVVVEEAPVPEGEELVELV